MNLVNIYPNYVKFNDDTIYYSIKEKLGITIDDDFLPMNKILQIEELVLTGTNYEYFPDIKKLQNLKNLKIIGCQGISDLDYISELPNLQELTMSYCDIFDISFMKSLTQIRFLNLCNIGISDISTLSKLKQLEKLNLQYNLIEDISSLQDLINLKELDLSGNINLENITPLTSMINLKLLMLYDISRHKNMYIKDLRRAIKEKGGNCNIIGSYRGYLNRL